MFFADCKRVAHMAWLARYHTLLQTILSRSLYVNPCTIVAVQNELPYTRKFSRHVIFMVFVVTEATVKFYNMKLGSMSILREE